MKHNGKLYLRRFGCPVAVGALLTLAACAPQVQVSSSGALTRIEAEKVTDLRQAAGTFAIAARTCLATADPEFAGYVFAGIRREHFGPFNIHFRNRVTAEAAESEVTVSLAPRLSSDGTPAGTTIEIYPTTTEFGRRLALFARGFPNRFDCTVFHRKQLVPRPVQTYTPIMVPIYRNQGGVYRPSRYTPVMIAR